MTLVYFYPAKNEPLLNVIHCAQYRIRGFHVIRAIWNENTVLFERFSYAKCFVATTAREQVYSIRLVHEQKPLQTNMAELFPSPEIKVSPSLSLSLSFYCISLSFSRFVSRNGIVE